MSLCPIQRAGNADLKYLRVNISHSKNSSGIAPDFHKLTVSGQTTPGYVVEPIIAFLSESVNFFYINSCFFRKKGRDFHAFSFYLLRFSVSVRGSFGESGTISKGSVGQDPCEDESQGESRYDQNRGGEPGSGCGK